MTETLFIRLGSMPHDIIHWLIWSNVNSDNNEENIIASGELSGAKALSALTDKAAQRKVITLVPSCDIALKSLQVPSKSQKAIQLAAPYMLEDDLAQDVDQLFFAYGNIKADRNSDNTNDNCFTAAVEHRQLNCWKTWLADADINCKIMIPDILAMPNMANSSVTVPSNESSEDSSNESWSAIRLDKQVLLRQGAWRGMVVDQQTWPIIYQQFNHAVISAYSTLPIEQAADVDTDKKVVIKAMPEALPLALFAQQIKSNAHQAFNLLQGQYQVKEKKSEGLKSWLWVAAIASIVLILNIGIKGAELLQLSAHQQTVEEKIIASYKSAFPESKRVRINTVKSQLKRKMAELGSTSTDGGFLAMLTKVEPAFSEVPTLKPESIKFDSKRQEIRLQAIAKDYQAFDKFKTRLEKSNLTVTQGAQNNQGDVISGSFSITLKSNVKGGKS